MQTISPATYAALHASSIFFMFWSTITILSLFIEPRYFPNGPQTHFPVCCITTDYTAQRVSNLNKGQEKGRSPSAVKNCLVFVSIIEEQSFRDLKKVTRACCFCLHWGQHEDLVWKFQRWAVGAHPRGGSWQSALLRPSLCGGALRMNMVNVTNNSSARIMTVL